MSTKNRPESLEGLPNFLVEHDKCDKGFDVTHPEGLGAGVISMKCRSCGKSFEFVPTTVEVEREVTIGPLEGDPIELKPTPKTGAPKKSIEPPLRVAAGGKRARNDLPRKRRSARSRRDRITVVVLLVFALAAFAFAIFRVLNERDGSTEPDASPTTPSAVATPPAEEPTQQQPKSQAPQPAEQQAAKPQKAAKPAATTRRARLAGSSIAVPADWSKSSSGDAVVLAPGQGPPVVSIRFYNESNPSLTASQMIAGTQGFLSSQAPNGSSLPVRRTKVGGDPAFTTGEKGAAGSQEALGVLAGSSRYLLIATAKPAATGAERAEMQRALKSFRAS